MNQSPAWTFLKTTPVLVPGVLALCGCLLTQPRSCAATFGEDVAFLKQHSDVIVLRDARSDAKVAVVPSMQGRVMTSTAQGDQGDSFGWMNNDLIAKNERQDHINVFGGEDRFWMGPEGGQFSIFFKKGDPFDLPHWETPEPIDWGGWEVVKQGTSSAHFRKRFPFTNYSGTRFDVTVDRVVSVYSRTAIQRTLGVKLGSNVKAVGYESDNRVTNSGANAWRKSTGLLSVWILGMFKHSPATTIVVPFKTGPESKLGPVVNDAYFGKVPADRLKIDAKKGVVYFKGDGQYRSKIGVPPGRAKDLLGSYSADNHCLTLVKFTLPKGAKDYVNSMWEIQKNPFAGDVANSYNDGPPAPGAKPLGPFYEMESSSPAAALAPGKSLTHVHRTIHVQGPTAELDRIAKATLGVGLAEIEAAF